MSARSTRGLAKLGALALASSSPFWSCAARAEPEIEVTSTPGVSADALARARQVVALMLSNAPDVRDRMIAAGFKLLVFRSDQVLTDVPEYAALKGKKTRDGRDYDTGTRGLGGPRLCSVGEENLLCLPRQKYRQEDILVHEFSHSIDAHLSGELAGAIRAAYDGAMREGLYPAGAYMARDAGEYWAEGTQAWFDVTVRSDVNGGINTRQKLQAHDPRLAELLARVYGSSHLAHYRDCIY